VGVDFALALALRAVTGPLNREGVIHGHSDSQIYLSSCCGMGGRIAYPGQRFFWRPPTHSARRSKDWQLCDPRPQAAEKDSTAHPHPPHFIFLFLRLPRCSTTQDWHNKYTKWWHYSTARQVWPHLCIQNTHARVVRVRWVRVYVAEDDRKPVESGSPAVRVL